MVGSKDGTLLKFHLFVAASEHINTAKAGYVIKSLCAGLTNVAQDSENSCYLNCSVILGGIPLSARAFKSSSPISPSQP